MNHEFLGENNITIMIYKKTHSFAYLYENI